MCERCGQLEERIAQLEEEAGLRVEIEKHVAARKALGIRPGAMHVLMALYGARGKLVRAWQIEETLPGQDHARERSDRIVDVHVCSLRKALGWDAIETIRCEGYRLTPSGLATMDALLSGHAPSGWLAYQAGRAA